MTEPLDVRIKPLHAGVGEHIPLPARQSEEAAGYDVCAAIDEPLTLASGAWVAVPCGFSMAFSKGFECQVRPRSGLAFKHGVTVLNAPGTIDSDYRGEVKVLLMNHGQQPFVIEPAMRIAQLVFASVSAAKISAVLSLDETARAAGGFGSTGT